MAQNSSSRYGPDLADEKSRPRSYQPQPNDLDGPNYQSRTRASTGDTQPVLHHPQPRAQPIKEPLNTAADTSATSQVSPELVAQITEQVLHSLKLNGLTPSAPSAPPQPKFQALGEGSQAIPPRNVYTPPSPERYSAPSVASLPPDFKDYQLDGQGDKDQHSVRFAERPATPPHNHSVEQPRPKPPLRLSTGDATTLEKIWQPLFEVDGQSTARLGQFLRGLAMHIIEDFEPQRSLVITPLKMLKFYNSVKLPEEIYPWNSIFGGKMTNSSLSHLYRDLKCEHHFVQIGGSDQKPCLPALTPSGFETWMTLLIRAHPDTEYKRFAEAVLHMPINNADNVKERFPKELSRRLFPADADPKVLMDVEDAIYADPVIELSQVQSASIQPPPPPAHASTSQQTHQRPPSPPPKVSSFPPSVTERSQKPPSQTSSEVAVEEGYPPVAIERERKPYYSQTGGGKVYDGEGSKSDGPPKRSNSTGHGVRLGVRDGQDDSMSSTAANAKQDRTRSQAPGEPPVVHRRRPRSPSMSMPTNPYSKANGDGLYTTLSNTGGPGASAVADGDEDERRRYKIRYSTEDSEPRGYAPAPSRGGYVDDRYPRGRRGSVQQGGSTGVSNYGSGTGHAAPARGYSMSEQSERPHGQGW